MNLVVVYRSTELMNNDKFKYNEPETPFSNDVISVALAFSHVPLTLFIKQNIKIQVLVICLMQPHINY